MLTIDELLDAINTELGDAPFPVEPGPPPRQNGAEPSQELMDKYTQDKATWDAWKLKHEAKLWYYDRYLPKAIGDDSVLNIKTRGYKHILEKNSQNKVIVTSATEAYALIQYQNSRSRWIAVFLWKKDTTKNGIKPPMYNSNKDETKEFKCLWSDYAHGQGSGWDPQALKVYNQRRQALVEFRAEEEEKGFPKMKEALAMIRKHHDIPDGELSYPGKKKGKKARPAQVQVDDGSWEDLVDDEE